MQFLYFAAETTETTTHASGSDAHESEGLPLGLSAEAFIIQLVTFVLIFMLLKKFAFNPIVNLLNKRHEVIDEGVKHGIDMQKEREEVEKQTAKIIREARHDADAIISDAQKEGREIVREAEKSAHKKTEIMMKDATARITEESEQTRRKLEKEITGLVAEATEAVVEEKIDAKKDAALIDKAIKKGRKG